MNGAPASREVLQGGVAHAGAVVRVGSQVHRPANPCSPTIHSMLRHVRERGFEGASEPIAVDGGLERLVFVPGDVPLPPYPAWAQRDEALTSTARLIRGLHDASVGFAAAASAWSDELRDPRPGDEPVICHNDVCPENVVFRDGAAVALLDFDFAAPGRRTYDLACCARMCVPVDTDEDAARLGWVPADRPRRLRRFVDAYGCDAVQRAEVLDGLDGTIERGGEFVKRHVDAGEPGFVEMWQQMGGMARFDRRRAWWAEHRAVFADALA
ncbi:MAG: phosphotransferase [Ilumatobacteraceae bacterium]